MNVLFVLLLGVALSPLRQEPGTELELTLETRGTRKSLTVTSNQTQVRVNEATRRGPTPPAQWRRLLGHLDGLRLADLPTLKASASRSATDAAYQAQLRITRDGKTYETETFDYPNAPKPLKGLLKTLVDTAPKADREEFQ